MNLLKEELEYTKRIYEELKEKQKKEGNMKCGSMPVQKCQVVEKTLKIYPSSNISTRCL